MSAFSERPGLREQMICALAGQHMTPVQRSECALDRVASFGAAQISAEQIARARAEAGLEPIGAMSLAPIGEAIEVQEVRRVGGAEMYASCAMDAVPPNASTPLPIASLDTGDAPGATIAIEPDLAGILLRLKYLPEESAGERGLAVELFARVICRDMRGRRDRNHKEPIEVLANVADQAISEWIAGVCTRCKGVGRVGATVGGVEERLVRCRACERTPGPRHPLRDLSPEERELHRDKGYAKYEGGAAGRYWTQDELNSIGAPSGRMRVTVPTIRDKDGNPQRALISCLVCCGRGTVIDRKRVRGRSGERCDRCAGLGHFMPSEAARAEAIGVSKETYRNRWQATFDAALRAARSLDRRLMGQVRAQLGRDLGAVG